MPLPVLLLLLLLLLLLGPFPLVVGGMPPWPLRRPPDRRRMRVVVVRRGVARVARVVGHGRLLPRPWRVLRRGHARIVHPHRLRPALGRHAVGCGALRPGAAAVGRRAARGRGHAPWGLGRA